MVSHQQESMERRNALTHNPVTNPRHVTDTFSAVVTAIHTEHLLTAAEVDQAEVEKIVGDFSNRVNKIVELLLTHGQLIVQQQNPLILLKSPREMGAAYSFPTELDLVTAEQRFLDELNDLNNYHNYLVRIHQFLEITPTDFTFFKEIRAIRTSLLSRPEVSTDELRYIAHLKKSRELKNKVIPETNDNALELFTFLVFRSYNPEGMKEKEAQLAEWRMQANQVITQLKSRVDFKTNTVLQQGVTLLEFEDVPAEPSTPLRVLVLQALRQCTKQEFTTRPEQLRKLLELLKKDRPTTAEEVVAAAEEFIGSSLDKFHLQFRLLVLIELTKILCNLYHCQDTSNPSLLIPDILRFTKWLELTKGKVIASPIAGETVKLVRAPKESSNQAATETININELLADAGGIVDLRPELRHTALLQMFAQNYQAPTQTAEATWLDGWAATLIKDVMAVYKGDKTGETCTIKMHIMPNIPPSDFQRNTARFLWSVIASTDEENYSSKVRQSAQQLLVQIFCTAKQ